MNPINWSAVFAGASLISMVVGALISVFYKLIVANLRAHEAMHEQKMIGLTEKFVERLGVVEERIAKHEGLVKSQLTSQERRIAKLEAQHRALLEKLARDYMLREDWVRHSTLLEAKIDSIGRQIYDMARGK